MRKTRCGLYLRSLIVVKIFRRYVVNKKTFLCTTLSLSYEEYLKLLKNMAITELKITINHEGAALLYRVLERKEMNLAKALLNDNAVKRSIKDCDGRTTMSLLVEVCNEDDDWVCSFICYAKSK